MNLDARWCSSSLREFWQCQPIQTLRVSWWWDENHHWQGDVIRRTTGRNVLHCTLSISVQDVIKNVQMGSYDMAPRLLVHNILWPPLYPLLMDTKLVLILSIQVTRKYQKANRHKVQWQLLLLLLGTDFLTIFSMSRAMFSDPWPTMTN